MPERETLVTVWSMSRASGYWLIERSFRYWYAVESLGLPEQEGEGVEREDGRVWAWFMPGKDPND